MADNFPGSAGKHIAHFYRTKEEAKRLYVSFLKEGLPGGDICLGILPSNFEAQEILSGLRSQAVEVEPAIKEGRLVLMQDRTSFVELHRKIQSLSLQLSEKQMLRCVLNATVDSNGAPSPPLTFWELLPAIFLYQYDLNHLSGTSLMDAQTRHPVWVINQVHYENPFWTNGASRQNLCFPRNFKNIVGESAGIKRVLKAVEIVAPTDANVLLHGETGTGKELVARAIQNRSPRKEKPFLKINCAALPSGLMESELFGHEKGSFTGALNKKLGRFEVAHGGTIFLDEIGDLQPDVQAKLLRVLQEGEFERVGGNQTIPVDVRVIAATNRNLEDSMVQGTFRADLYYRLNVFPIHIPPLRERKEDIPLLVKYFVMKHGARFRKNIERISQSTIDALVEYEWPGNIRELENLLERAVILCQTTQLDPGKWLPQQTVAAPGVTKIPTLVELEREHILEVLRKTCWRVSGNSGAARVLGMKPTTLEARMKNSESAAPSKTAENAEIAEKITKIQLSDLLRSLWLVFPSFWEFY